MTNKKVPIGFRTSAKLLEEQFIEISEQLEKKTKSWTELSNEVRKLAIQTRDTIEELRKQNRSMEANELLNLHMGCWILFKIAELGIELNETHKRLAKIEKKLCN